MIREYLMGVDKGGKKMMVVRWEGVEWELIG